MNTAPIIFQTVLDQLLSKESGEVKAEVRAQVTELLTTLGQRTLSFELVAYIIMRVKQDLSNTPI